MWVSDDILTRMEDVVYDLVREFLLHGPPASRNQAYEAYSDARFARAARIYQFLISVREDLASLLRDNRNISVQVEEEDERIALVLTYGTEKINRRAYLGRVEWQLVWDEPQFRELFARLGIAAPPELPPFRVHSDG